MILSSPATMRFRTQGLVRMEISPNPAQRAIPSWKKVHPFLMRMFNSHWKVGRCSATVDPENKPTQRKTMSQAIMDPAEVRRFAEEMKRFNIELQNRMALLQARFAALGDTWQDQEHARFSEEFRDTMKVLKRFIESSNQHTPYLLRKAQRIEEYLNQH